MATTKPIVVGYEPSTADRAPVDFGVAMARLAGVPLVVVSVHSGAPTPPVSGEPLQYGVGQPEADLPADSSPALQQVEAELTALGVPVECRTLAGASAAKALHEAAEAMDAGLLVVGSSKRSPLGRVLAGASTGERLIHGAPCPVAVVPRDWRQEGKLAAVGVAYVDSEEGREALHSGAAVARRAGAALRAFTVVEPRFGMHLETEAPMAGHPVGKGFETVLGEHRTHAEGELRRVVEALDGVDAQADGLIGDPAEVLIDVSEELGVLVCGSRGYGPPLTVLLGSVSRRVTQGAHCPVIVVPRGVQGLAGCDRRERP